MMCHRSRGPLRAHVIVLMAPMLTMASGCLISWLQFGAPNGQYVYSYGLDGYVHKLAVSDGAETLTGGWPDLVTRKGWDEKGSSALSMAKARNGVTFLYMVTAGYPGDRGDYQGHLVAIDLSTGAQKVYNTLCANQAVHFVAAPGTPDCADVQSGA